jgi:hypothetical protein
MNRPWYFKNLIVFSNREKALEFERYLKSPSGRAFAKKEVLNQDMSKGTPFPLKTAT